MLGGDAGDADAGSLNGQDFIDGGVFEQLGPFFAHLVKERRIHLVV